MALGTASPASAEEARPVDYGPPVGYWAFLRDPDGHTLEVTYGQEVGDAVADAAGD